MACDQQAGRSGAAVFVYYFVLRWQFCCVNVYVIGRYMLYCRMKICDIKSCLCEKVRFFILNCVGFYVQGVGVTGGNVCFAF